MKRPRWTEEQDALLRSVWGSMGSRCSHLFPGRSVLAIQQRAVVIGIAKEKGGAWTEEEDSILRAKWPALGVQCGCFLPNRSKSSIQARARRLHIPCVLNRKPREKEAKRVIPLNVGIPANSIFDLAQKAA